MPDAREFDRLFSKRVPHIHEMIFFSMDYASFKNCLEVSMQWREMLTSESFKRKGKYAFQEEIHMELMEAAEIGNITKIKMILSNFMIDINLLTASHWVGRCDDSVLIRAAENGHKDAVQLLLDNGAEPNTASKDGLTALHEAAFMGFEDVVKILLEGGAEANAATAKYGWTPLLYASTTGSKNVVQLLLDKGAVPNMANYAGYTPLYFAMEYINPSRTDVVRLLLDRGADPNMTYPDGWTPLHTAASDGYIDEAQLLLDKGAQINMEDPNEMTPFYYATVNGHKDLADMLKKNGGTY